MSKQIGMNLLKTVALSVAFICGTSFAVFAEEVKIGSGAAAIENIFNKITEPLEKADGVKLVISASGPVQAFKDMDTDKIVAAVGGLTLPDWIAMMEKEGYAVPDKTVYHTQVIGKDIIKVLTNKAVTVSALSKEQLTSIFSGKTKKWSEVGGPDHDVVVILGSKIPGTQVVFQQQIMGGAAYAQNAVEGTTAEDLKARVISTPGAICLGASAQIDGTINAPAIPEVGRPITMVTKKAPSGGLQKMLDYLNKDGQLYITSLASADPVVINFCHVVEENTPKGQMAVKFKELVDERLKGKVVVKIFPKSRLFNDEQLFEALWLDDAQMGAPSLADFKQFTPKLQVFDLPFLFENIAAVDRFQKGPSGQEFLSILREKGLVGLGYLHNGMKQLSATKELRKPEDAAGLKFRIQSSDVISDQFKTLEAIPVPAIFKQTFALLKSGAVDGQENTWSNIYSQKYQTVQPFMTESNHGILDYMVITSVEFWDSLPDSIRTELKKTVDEAIAFGNEKAQQSAIGDRKKIEESQTTKITVLSKEERQKWIEKMRPVWSKYEGAIGKEVIDEAYRSNAQ
jgi:C4-dicarboxylate-binding protein DctP